MKPHKTLYLFTVFKYDHSGNALYSIGLFIYTLYPALIPSIIMPCVTAVSICIPYSEKWPFRFV